MIWSGPTKISDFRPLPNSIKSQLSGDTWQVPNVVGYFSNNERDFAINYYKDQYDKLTNLPFRSLRLNYPPEFAYTAIKDQTESTYLEEFVYPLRDSFFVNGFEPFYHDGRPKFRGATKFEAEGLSLNTKVTLRFYPSPLWVKIVTWLGITLSTLLLFKMSKRVLTS